MGTSEGGSSEMDVVWKEAGCMARVPVRRWLRILGLLVVGGKIEEVVE